MSRPGDRLRALFLPQDQSPGLVAQAPPVPVREIVRRFWPYARPYRRWLLVTLVLIVAAAALETASVWIFKLLVDEVLVPRDLSPLVWVAAAYVGINLVGGAVAFADDVLSTWVSERFLLDLRTRFFSHLQTLPLEFFESRRLGDVLSRLTGDIAAIEGFVLSGIADALSYALRLAFFTGALFYLQPDLAAVALVVAPLFWYVARRLSALMKRASREKRRRSGSIGAVAEESLANVALVHAYGAERREIDRFHAENLGAFRAQMTATRLRAAFRPLIDAIELLGGLLVIGYGTVKLSDGAISLGGLLVFLTYLSKMYSPMRGMSRLTASIYQASAGAERVIEFLEERPTVSDPPRPLEPARRMGHVRLDGVTFRYPGAAQDAVTDIDLEVAPGEILALVGESGAGKSTLFRLVLRFADPARGRILLDDHDLRDYALKDLRANVAVVLQETLVLDATVFENIAYGSPLATREDVERAARAADAHDFILQLPDGYDTRVGQRGRRLSGGQRQRVAIARAMVRDAPVLLLDEPTTGLDVESSLRVLEPLRRLMEGRSCIVISHDLLTTRDATRIAVLDRGRVVELGSHEELLARGGRYRRLYEAHARDTVTELRPGVAP